MSDAENNSEQPITPDENEKLAAIKLAEANHMDPNIIRAMQEAPASSALIDAASRAKTPAEMIEQFANLDPATLPPEMRLAVQQFKEQQEQKKLEDDALLKKAALAAEAGFMAFASAVTTANRAEAAEKTPERTADQRTSPEAIARDLALLGTLDYAGWSNLTEPEKQRMTQSVIDHAEISQEEYMKAQSMRQEEMIKDERLGKTPEERAAAVARINKHVYDAPPNKGVEDLVKDAEWQGMQPAEVVHMIEVYKLQKLYDISLLQKSEAEIAQLSKDDQERFQKLREAGVTLEDLKKEEARIADTLNQEIKEQNQRLERAQTPDEQKAAMQDVDTVASSAKESVQTEAQIKEFLETDNQAGKTMASIRTEALAQANQSLTEDITDEFAAEATPQLAQTEQPPPSIDIGDPSASKLANPLKQLIALQDNSPEGPQEAKISPTAPKISNGMS